MLVFSVFQIKAHLGEWVFNSNGNWGSGRPPPENFEFLKGSEEPFPAPCNLLVALCKALIFVHIGCFPNKSTWGWVFNCQINYNGE